MRRAARSTRGRAQLRGDAAVLRAACRRRTVHSTRCFLMFVRAQPTMISEGMEYCILSSLHGTVACAYAFIQQSHEFLTYFATPIR